jgi:hypothetical protein
LGKFKQRVVVQSARHASLSLLQAPESAYKNTSPQSRKSLIEAVQILSKFLKTSVLNKNTAFQSRKSLIGAAH